MRIYSQADVINALPYDRLTAELPAQLLQKTEAPQRHVHTVHQSDEPDASLLLMPAWNKAGVGGVKLVNVTPGNAKRALPAVTASYLIFDAVTGEHKALLDGSELTARRTAAVAAVAASRLARSDARRLVLIGSGRIASELAFAYRAVRPIEQVTVVSQTRVNADRLVVALKSAGFAAQAADDVDAAIVEADIIACATLSHTPLVRGALLKPGQHVALIGGYLPDMREADDETMRRAAVWVDSHAAMSEAGDLVQPLLHGVIRLGDIQGTLTDLCAIPSVAGRDNTITLFKSVGDASQDLAAASLAAAD